MEDDMLPVYLSIFDTKAFAEIIQKNVAGHSCTCRANIELWIKLRKVIKSQSIVNE